ncbi:hypothetical protein [Ferrimonas marina]|nr:hypothetical protein [Ferrimonas marina]
MLLSLSLALSLSAPLQAEEVPAPPVQQASQFTVVDINFCSISLIDIAIHDATGAVTMLTTPDPNGVVSLNLVPEGGYVSIIQLFELQPEDPNEPPSQQVVMTSAHKSLFQYDGLWQLTDYFGQTGPCKMLSQLTVTSLIPNANEFVFSLVEPVNFLDGSHPLNLFNPYLLGQGFDSLFNMAAYKLQPAQGLTEGQQVDMFLDQQPNIINWTSDGMVDAIAGYYFNLSLPYLLESKFVGNSSGTLALLQEEGEHQVLSQFLLDPIILQQASPVPPGTTSLSIKTPIPPVGLYSSIQVQDNLLQFELGDYAALHTLIGIGRQGDQGSAFQVVFTPPNMGQVTLPMLPEQLAGFANQPGTSYNLFNVRADDLTATEVPGFGPVFPDPELVAPELLLQLLTLQNLPYTNAIITCGQFPPDTLCQPFPLFPAAAKMTPGQIRLQIGNSLAEMEAR